MINKMKALMALLLFSTLAQAGWVSSGGELFKDAHNPWFLEIPLASITAFKSHPLFLSPKGRFRK